MGREKMYKEIYRSAWKRLKARYFINVVIVFLVGLFLKDGYQYATDWTADYNARTSEYELRETKKTNFEIITDMLNAQNIVPVNTEDMAQTSAQKYTMGYFSVIVNEITASGSFGMGIMNGLNKILFKGQIGESVTIFIMMLLSALLWIVFKNLIMIGRCRFFLESRAYPDTKADRLLFVYHTGNFKNAVKIMLIRSLRQFLWDLTIIGGIVKHYEYYMIPYVLAENPSISTEEAFALSKQLMYGDKKKTFLIDLSLMPGFLLDGATFHLTSVFFLNPYKECLIAELYCALREKKYDTLEKAELLNDTLLYDSYGLDKYPDEKCPAGYVQEHHLLNSDHDKTYGGNTFILFFFFFSIFGWVFEVFFYLINEGSFINRGTMTGPWLPIYGFGGLMIIYCLRPMRQKPALLFASSVVVCGTLEYFTSWALEKIVGLKWWDYTGYFMNINGRVCLEGLTVFGLMGVAMTYFIAPVVDDILAKLPKKTRNVLCIVLLVLFAADCIWSVGHPNTGNGITEGFY